MPPQDSPPQNSADATRRSPASRRSFLQAGIAGAVVVGGTVGSGTPAAAAAATPTSVPAAPTPARAAGGPAARAAGGPDLESPRFTLVVMPDTQYLFDGDSIHPAPLASSLRYVLDQQQEQNIVFMAHLGDVTQNGRTNEVAAAAAQFDAFDRRGVPWSVLAGNHDIDGRTDDQRGPTPYLAAFGPSRFAGRPGYSASPDGYNSANLFRAGGREWLVLALDWRVSDGGLAWATATIRRHPTTPVILTIHELVDTDDSAQPAQLSEFGQHVWDTLIRGNDQIFLSLNGHFWPPGRTTKTNDAGSEVALHITNYQDRYYGGAAMIRLYRFDMERSTIDVETINPWLLGMPYESLNELSREELELTSPVDAASVPIDFAARFARFAPATPRPARPARAVLVPGTTALWGRFTAGRTGSVVTGRIPDLSGGGNDLLVAGRPGARRDALTLSDEHHPDQPSRGSVFFQGGRAAGDYLKTVAGAPLNATTAAKGFTLEVFAKLPADWGPDNAWSGLVSRQGSSGDAGKTGGYSSTEPVATLSLSGSVEAQWYAYPLNLNTSVTNWSHLLPLDTWWHLAVTNDGRHTRMYVDGCEVVRNPATVAHGIATVGRSWLVGGHEDGGRIDQVHYGWLGDIRVVDHALAPGQFMIA